MERALLARHGESKASVLGLANGALDPAVRLTERGREEARGLGRLLSGEPIDLAVTTELARTQETADLALAGRDVPRLVVPELNEIRYGSYEGATLGEYRGWAGAAGPEELAPGGGESRAQVAARFARGYRAVLARPERTILVVGHALAIRYVLTGPAPVVESVPYAQVFPFARDELEAAVERLEAWASEPRWSTPNE